MRERDGKKMERRIKRGKERVRKRERDDVWLTGRDPGKSRVVVFFFKDEE